jgi:hypothetical protein
VPPLIESDEVVDALEVYDGDVIEHPTLGGPMTIAAHMHHHPEPNILELTPGVVTFDVMDDMTFDGELDPDREVLELAVVPGMRVRRLFRYVPPPGYAAGDDIDRPGP